MVGGTIGAVEMRDQEEETLDEAIESRPEGETHFTFMQSDSGLEENCIGQSFSWIVIHKQLLYRFKMKI